MSGSKKVFFDQFLRASSNAFLRQPLHGAVKALSHPPQHFVIFVSISVSDIFSPSSSFVSDGSMDGLDWPALYTPYAKCDEVQAL